MSGVGTVFQRLLADGADVHVLDRRMREFLRVVKRGQAVEPVVRNLGHADVRLARIGPRLVRKMRLGQNPKQRCLAHLRQANDSSLHRKASSSWLLATANAEGAQSGYLQWVPVPVVQPFRINDEVDIAQLTGLKRSGRARLQSYRKSRGGCWL